MKQRRRPFGDYSRCEAVSFIGALVCLFSAPVVAQFPEATDLISDCENRWVLEGGDDPATRMLGFVYVDPTLGFTINLDSRVETEADGSLVRQASELEGRARTILRVTSNFAVACLSESQTAQLGVPIVPDWLEVYRDTREAGQHNSAWASFYNRVGAPEEALEYIREAQSLGYSSQELVFEHGYALNALGRFDAALDVLEGAVAEYPEDIHMLAELGYAHLHLGNYMRGIEVYETAISEDRRGRSGRRPEFAQMIAAAYAQLGDEEEAADWMEKAEKWMSDRE